MEIDCTYKAVESGRELCGEAVLKERENDNSKWDLRGIVSRMVMFA